MKPAEKLRLGAKHYALSVLGLALLAVAMKVTGVFSCASLVAEADLVQLALALASIHACMLFFALSWYVLIWGRISFRRAYAITWACRFVNLLIPSGSITGEALRLYLTVKSGVNRGEASSSIVVHRLLTLLPFIAFSILGLIAAGARLERGTMLGILVSVGVLMGIFYAAFHLSTSEKALLRFLSFFWRRLGRGSHDLSSLVEEHVAYFKGYVRSTRTILSAGALSLLSWMFDVLPVLFVFSSLGYRIPVGLGIFAYSVNVLMTALPTSIPGNLGIREGAMIAILAAYGVPKSIAGLATFLASTVVIFLNQLLFGYLFYLSIVREL